MASIINRDLSPVFRRLEKGILAARFLLRFPPVAGTWPKYEYIKPWIAALNPGTVIDVGVNTGQFLHLAYRLYPKAQIVGVEPLRDLCDRMARHYAKDPRVRMECCACGSSSGETQFYVVSDSQNCSTLEPTKDFYDEHPDVRLVETNTVPVRTLADILVELPGPYVIKVDVQGTELEVLKGLAAAMDKVDVIIVEAPFETAYTGASGFDDIYQYLTGQGFAYQGALGQLYSERTGRVRQEDSVYVRHSTLISQKREELNGDSQ